MGAELGILSSSIHPHKHKKNQQNPHYNYPPNHHPGGSWMRKPKQVQDDDDSWEVRAFAGDTGSILGATWPPRSYTCTFCMREFRSAQALGGHMNVHRRDRARLHQEQSPAASATSSPSSSPSTFIFPNPDFPGSAGVCLLYQTPNPDAVFSTPTSTNTSDTPLSISPYLGQNKNNLLGQVVNFPAKPSRESSPRHFYPSNVDIKADIVATTDKSKTTIVNSPSNNKRKDLANEEPELDLELRLGHRSRKAAIWPDRR